LYPAINVRLNKYVYYREMKYVHIMINLISKIKRYTNLRARIAWSTYMIDTVLGICSYVHLIVFNIMCFTTNLIDMLAVPFYTTVVFHYVQKREIDVDHTQCLISEMFVYNVIWSQAYLGDKVLTTMEICMKRLPNYQELCSFEKVWEYFLVKGKNHNGFSPN